MDERRQQECESWMKWSRQRFCEELLDSVPSANETDFESESGVDDLLFLFFLFLLCSTLLISFSPTATMSSSLPSYSLPTRTISPALSLVQSSSSTSLSSLWWKYIALWTAFNLTAWIMHKQVTSLDLFLYPDTWWWTQKRWRAAQEIWHIVKDLIDSKVFVELSTTTSSSVDDFTQVTKASFSAAGIKKHDCCSC